MGLDITAYEKIELVEAMTHEELKAKDWEHPLYEDYDHVFISVVDEVVDAYQALKKVQTDEFVLANRALVAHWQRLTDCAHARRIEYRCLDDVIRRSTPLAATVTEGE